MPRRASRARGRQPAKSKSGADKGARRRRLAPGAAGGKGLEEALRFVAERSWAIGAEGFFPTLVRHLGESLGLDYAMVSALTGDGQMAETVSVYAKGKIVPNMRYPLRDAPCGRVMGQKLCLYPEGVRKLFPKDTLLTELGVEGYIGIPLWDSRKRPIGLIAVLDGKPMAHGDSIAGALQLVATRAAMELERKRDLEEQRLAAQRMALHVEQTPLAVIEWDLDFRVRGWNPAAERIFGFTREEALGRHASFIVPETARERVNAVWQALLAQGGGTRSTNENITKQCRIIMCDWFNTPLVDAEGRTVGVASLVEDVTERHRAEEQRARLGMAVEQAVESIMITDTDGVILYVNPAFEEVTGYRRDEAVGKKAGILKSGKHEDAYYRSMWETIGGGGVWRGNFINRRKDGQLFEEAAIISPVRDAAGKIVNYVAVKRDVTRERQVEEQLRQSQKMNAIGQLAGGVAHDFNNLLNVILGYSDMLLEEAAISEEARGQIGEIQKAGERAAAMTRQLLAFSRKQILDPRVFDLGALVADVSKMLRRLIGEHIELNLVSSSSVCSIRADPGQIEQVIMNLCVNARDAMPGGGKLTIETRRVAGTGNLSGQGWAGKESVVLSIGDTGTGMSPEVKAHLFEPFFTTKKEGTGVGLGLATCYGIVRQSGGEISVHSEEGRGTTFEIRFPYVPEPVTREDPRRALAGLEQGRGETILLVEDDDAVREMVERLLTGLGYRVLAAGGGEDALALAGSSGGGRIDLLLTDVIMPGMNGRDVAAQIRSRFPGVKVIFTSGYAEEAIVRDGVLESGIVFMPKPFALVALARRIREVLGD